MQNKAHLLAAGMHNRRAARFGEQSPEGIQFAHLERVDHGQGIWGSHLNQAELAAVGVLRDEFGVKR